MRLSAVIFPAIVVSAPIALVASCKKPDATTPSAPVYSTKGTIKKIGPDKSFVNIAHENIPNYMDAMTMSFEPGKAGQLDGFAEGDRVSFSFSATDDGKRIIQAIKKE